jgi:hypothetical protein
MAHDTGDADIGDVHYDQGIPYGDPQGRTPQKPEGYEGIDNWLRNLLGGDPLTQAEGGKPTNILGVLPQSPTQQIGMNRVPQPPTGAPIFPQTLDSGVRGGAGDYDDLGGLELFGPGGGLEAGGSMEGRAEGEDFDPGSVGPSTTNPIQEAVTQAQQTRPDANFLNTVDPSDLSVEGSPMGGLQAGDQVEHGGSRALMAAIFSLLGIPMAGAGLTATGLRGSAQGANPFFQGIRNFLGAGRGPKVPLGRQLTKPQGQGAPTYTPSVIRQPPPTGTQGELFGTMG